MTEFSTVSPAFVIGTQQPRELLGIGDELDANLLSNAVPDLQWQTGGVVRRIDVQKEFELHQENGIGRLNQGSLRLLAGRAEVDIDFCSAGRWA